MKKPDTFAPEDIPDFKSAEEFNQEETIYPGTLEETIYPDEALRLFFKSLGEAIPENMTMTITINGNQ